MEGEEGVLSCLFHPKVSFLIGHLSYDHFLNGLFSGNPDTNYSCVDT